MLVPASGCRTRLRAIALTLVVVICALALPMTAGAAIYTVDSTGEQPDDNVGNAICHTAENTCTLRAALQESNASTTVDDEIKFNAEFEGHTSDFIAREAGFPAITDKVTIDGDGAGQCTTQAPSTQGFVKGPCVSTGGLVVEHAHEVTIEGMSLVGSPRGIDVTEGATRFTGKDDWIGITLNGSASANTTGIYLRPGSDEATIGGPNPAERNVIAGNSGGNAVGLDIEGASSAIVEGNYFGLAPDGVTQRSNTTDLEITDSTECCGLLATGNRVGAEVGGAAEATAACDGGCNVFASGPSERAIDLEGDESQGELPATGPTAIQGNYIGLDAFGERPGTMVFSAQWGIYVGGADAVTVGGSGEGAANHINAGQIGVYGEKPNDLVVKGNLIGLNPAGTSTLAPPTEQGVYDSSIGITEADTAEIIGNRISMAGGEAIKQQGSGALIARNQIGRGAGGQELSGGSYGIQVWGNDELVASDVHENVVENSGIFGILIQNGGNLITGNTVQGAALSGIRLEGFATTPPFTASDNTIGGEDGSSENTISGSGNAAIAVVQGAGVEPEEEGDIRNQVERNRGSGNGGLFIDLGQEGPGNALKGANGGIQAPTISSATATEASGGGAEPGATILVFRKATAANGEIASFLGKATANGGGNWSVAYAALPGETRIGATQSDPAKGTSEMAVATTPPAPAGGGGGGGGGGKGKGQGARDTTPPETTITRGPRKRTRKRTVKFSFASSEKGSGFQCKLDRKPFRACSTPKKYKRLKLGKHVFKVRAIDRAGNIDPTPAVRKFRVIH